MSVYVYLEWRIHVVALEYIFHCSVWLWATVKHDVWEPPKATWMGALCVPFGCTTTPHVLVYSYQYICIQQSSPFTNYQLLSHPSTSVRVHVLQYKKGIWRFEGPCMLVMCTVKHIYALFLSPVLSTASVKGGFPFSVLRNTSYMRFKKEIKFLGVIPHGIYIRWDISWIYFTYTLYFAEKFCISDISLL